MIIYHLTKYQTVYLQCLLADIIQIIILKSPVSFASNLITVGSIWTWFKSQRIKLVSTDIVTSWSCQPVRFDCLEDAEANRVLSRANSYC